MVNSRNARAGIKCSVPAIVYKRDEMRFLLLFSLFVRNWVRFDHDKYDISLTGVRDVRILAQRESVPIRRSTQIGTRRKCKRPTTKCGVPYDRREWSCPGALPVLSRLIYEGPQRNADGRGLFAWCSFPSAPRSGSRHPGSIINTVDLPRLSAV